MARPCKQRFISAVPVVSGFRPNDTTVRRQLSATLMSDELETLRLADIEGLSQEEGAARMNVSRATFGRILERAHRTVADALVNGRPLQIGGGDVVQARHVLRHCRRCQRDWNIPRTTVSEFRCPRCH